MTTTEVSRLPRVAVACEHSLVAQSVSAALGGRGHDVVLVGWPGAVRRPSWLRAARPAAAEPVGRPGSARLPERGVLISDLDRPRRVDDACRLVSGVPVPWLVLAGSPPGPSWGAVLDAGAVAVLPASTDLDTLAAVLAADADQAWALLGDRLRADLVEQWCRDEERRTAARSGLAALTARERQVLDRLHAGDTVREISALDEVSEATVRSQVKAVLRKLDVGSQVAAVSRYEMVLGPGR